MYNNSANGIDCTVTSLTRSRKTSHKSSRNDIRHGIDSWWTTSIMLPTHQHQSADVYQVQSLHYNHRRPLTVLHRIPSSTRLIGGPIYDRIFDELMEGSGETFLTEKCKELFRSKNVRKVSGGYVSLE